MYENAPYLFRLYGTDSFVTVDSNSLTNVSALVSAINLVSMDLSTYRFDISGENESEAIDCIGGIKIENPKERTKFNFELGYFDKKTELNKYLEFKALMKKKYKFFSIENHPYSLPLHSENQAIGIAIIERTEEEENRYKKITFTAVKRNLD